MWARGDHGDVGVPRGGDERDVDTVKTTLRRTLLVLAGWLVVPA